MAFECIVPRKSSKSDCPFTFEEKVDGLARVKLHGADPAVVLAKLNAKYDRVMSGEGYPAQSFSAWTTMLEKRVRDGDAEAIKLAEKYGFELREICETG